MPRLCVSGECREFKRQKETQDILSTEIQKVVGGGEAGQGFPDLDKEFWLHQVRWLNALRCLNQSKDMFQFHFKWIMLQGVCV